MTEETKDCPICKEVKPIGRDFGLRLKPEGFRPNSWCRKCRATGKIKSQIEREKPIMSGKIIVAVTKQAEAPVQPLAVRFERTDLQTWLRRIYQETYPGDKAGDKRSINFMKSRLTKKGVI